MGHRHLRGSSQMFNDEPDQGWNHIHPEHPYTSQARSGTSDNRSNVHPAENMLNDGMPVSSHWNSSPVPNYNPGDSGLSQDPFLNSSTVATFSAPPENYVTFASSSNCNSHTWSNASFVDQSVESIRGAQKPEFIKIPVGKRRLIETTQGFEELTSLPNICGAIDSTPVKLKRRTKLNPRNIYSCKYGYDAVLLQVVADHKKIFWDVCVKAPGGEDDSSHFRDSLLYKRLTEGDIVWEKVINIRGHHVRPYIVGDWCYPLLSFLMTPFSPNGSGSPPENLFDGMLMKGRSVVVEAIGLLKARWKILQSLNVGVNHAPQTIVACCVLHNLCQIAREPEPEIWKDPDEAGLPARVLESERQFYYYGQSLRQALADDLHQRLSSR